MGWSLRLEEQRVGATSVGTEDENKPSALSASTAQHHRRVPAFLHGAAWYWNREHLEKVTTKFATLGNINLCLFLFFGTHIKYWHAVPANVHLVAQMPLRPAVLGWLPVPVTWPKPREGERAYYFNSQFQVTSSQGSQGRNLTQLVTSPRVRSPCMSSAHFL